MLLNVPITIHEMTTTMIFDKVKYKSRLRKRSEKQRKIIKNFAFIFSVWVFRFTSFYLVRNDLQTEL